MPAFWVRERVTASASRSPWCRKVQEGARERPLGAVDRNGSPDQEYGQPVRGERHVPGWFVGRGSGRLYPRPRTAVGSRPASPRWSLYGFGELAAGCLEGTVRGYLYRLS